MHLTLKKATSTAVVVVAVTSLFLPPKEMEFDCGLLRGPGPPGAVLKRHCSDVDRNTFIGIVSAFKWRGRGGGRQTARAASVPGRARHLI